MNIIKTQVEKVDTYFHIVQVIKYSDNKHVKRIWNTKGELVDAIPLKNYSNNK